MGIVTSFLGKGMSTAQMLNMLTGTLYKEFIEKDVNNFDDFHSAILDMFSIVNSALPGKHYDAPPRKEIEECFATWQESPESERMNVFVNFMKKRVNLSKLDNYTVIAGIVTPPAAMAAKKAGENVPQIKIIKAIPDVIFVPAVTVLALISAKISRNVIQVKTGNSAIHDTGPRPRDTSPDHPPNTTPTPPQYPSTNEWADTESTFYRPDTTTPAQFPSPDDLPNTEPTPKELPTSYWYWPETGLSPRQTSRIARNIETLPI